LSEWGIADTIEDELLEELAPNAEIDEMIYEHMNEDAHKALDEIYEKFHA